MAQLKLVVTDTMDDLHCEADGLTCTYKLNCDVVIEYNLSYGKQPQTRTQTQIGTAIIELRINVNEEMTDATHDIFVGKDRFGGFGGDLDDYIDYGDIDVEKLKSDYINDCNNSYNT